MDESKMSEMMAYELYVSYKTMALVKIQKNKYKPVKIKVTEKIKLLIFWKNRLLCHKLLLYIIKYQVSWVENILTFISRQDP